MDGRNIGRNTRPLTLDNLSQRADRLEDLSFLLKLLRFGDDTYQVLIEHFKGDDPIQEIADSTPLTIAGVMTKAGQVSLQQAKDLKQACADECPQSEKE